MVFEISPQGEQNDGRSLAVARNDERTISVQVLEVVVERGGYVIVGHTGNRGIDVPCFLPRFLHGRHAGLTVIRHEQVGGSFKRGRVPYVLELHAIAHLGVVEGRVFGGALFQAPHDILRRVNVERIDVLGDFRHLVPTGLLGVVRRNAGRFR